MRRHLHRDVLVVTHIRRSFVGRDAALLSTMVHTDVAVANSPIALVRTLAMVVSSGSVLVWFASYPALPVVLLARLLCRPVVVVPGGYEVTASEEDGYGWQGSRARRSYVRWTLRFASETIAVSPAMIDAIAASAGPVRLRMVPNAVPAVLPVSVSSTVDGQREFDVATAIVTTSEAARRNKGIDLFLAAAGRLPESRFLLIGDAGGPVPPNVLVTGVVPHDVVLDLLGRTRAYVQATRGHEAFGMGVVEAMLMGCTPVVTPVGALPWLVGSAGVVMDDVSVDGLCAALHHALAAPADRPGEAVAERFSGERRLNGLAVALGLLDPETLRPQTDGTRANT